MEEAALRLPVLTVRQGSLRQMSSGTFGPEILGTTLVHTNF